MLAFIDGQAIAEWAARIGASHQLPRLIRRLIWATLSPLEIKRINFPAGADVQLPGFDGQLETSVQSQWTPEGRSVWELSVQGQSSTKARKDYIKRRNSLKASERAQLAYVAVSARRWKDQTKQDWTDSIGSDDELVGDRLASRSVVVTDSAWAQALSDHRNLIVIQRTAELDLMAALRDRHHVLVPLGRDDVQGRDSIRLERASRFDFARALEKMGFSDSEADRLAYECGRSITIFHRRRPAAQVDPPDWRSNPVLLPVLMAGRWDRSNVNDREILRRPPGPSATKTYNDSSLQSLT